MRSGELRHLVTIQRPVYAVNAAGDSVITGWEGFAAVRAGIRHLTSNEADRFARLQTVVTHHVTLRYLPGVTSIMRLIWGDKILAIAEIGLDPTARKNLYLKCTELKPDTADDDPGSESYPGSSPSGPSGSAEVHHA